MPRGTRVAQGEILTGDILPYDPSVDGPGTAPPADIVAIRSTSLVERAIPTTRGLILASTLRARARAGAGAPALTSTGVHRGWFLYAGRGVYARNDARPEIDIPPGYSNNSKIYAPTTLAPGGSCWEVTTIHWIGAAYVGSPPNDAIGLWDWCNAVTFTRYYDISANSTFSSHYVRSQYDEWGKLHSVYFMVVQPTNFSLGPTDYDCWNVFFYNFSTGSYDNMQQTSCGTTQIANQGGAPTDSSGWTMHESYGVADHANSPSCPSIPAVDVGQVSLYVMQGGTLTSPGAHDDPSYWSELNISVPGDCFSTGAWAFVENPSYPNYWFAWTPSTN